MDKSNTHYLDNIASEIDKSTEIPDSTKKNLLLNLQNLKKTKVNILITGPTGCGKSSTINALFNQDKAKVGQGVDPETMDIQKYEYENIVLFDTPGVGDGKEADIRHSKNIIGKLYEKDSDGKPLIDLVLVILNGGSRDLGTFFELINQVIIPNLGTDKNRLLVAINQCDIAMKGRHWNSKENQPEPPLIDFLNEKVTSTKRRIKEATDVDIDPIYYSAGYKDGNQSQNPYNLSKLLLFILKHTKQEKRAVIIQDVNNNQEEIWKDNDKLQDYGKEIKYSLWDSVAKFAGQASGSIGSAMNFADNVIFNAERGHGFAGERANHLHDVFTGKDASIVGSDNKNNGPDRLVDGIYIQTKYCKTGSKCVSEAFENDSYRYFNNDGSPMQLEVPSDKYDDAVKAMEERIKKGQVKNVTDPKKAKEIIRKGSYTYEQARNIARFGTIESITFDAVNGVKIAGSAMGISAAISFAVQLWSGEDWDIALKSACYDGLKVGGIAWVSSILTAQIGRTGIEQSLRGTTDWLVKQMGHKATAWLANGLRSGSNIYGAAATNYVSKLLRGNIVTGIVTTIVLSSADFVRLFDGRVSGAQVFKNVTTTAAGVAGGTGGWMGGAAAGAAIGSAIPIIGTAVGGIIGGIFGSIAGGSAASAVASGILDSFIEDDAKEMLRIVENIFGDLAFDYVLNKQEAEIIIGKIQKMDLPDFLRDMYASKNRRDFARVRIEPMIEEIAKNRKIIRLPSNQELVTGTRYMIEDLMNNTQQPA